MYYYFPVVLILIVNTLYHVSAKGMPDTGNAFAPLIWTYLTSALVTLVLFFITNSGDDLVVQMKSVNFFPFLFGVILVGLEYGFVLLYRVGWDVSIGSTVCNIGLAIIMALVGVLFYKNHLSLYQIMGILFCGVGLFLLNKK